MKILRHILLFVLAFSAFQASISAQEEFPGVDKINRSVRKKVVLMYESDQYWRMICAADKLDMNSASCKKMSEIDRKNTEQLKQIVKKYGFPNAELIGIDVAQHAITIVIHSPSIQFQKENLPSLNEAAKTNEYIRPDIAVLTDKILVAEKKPQIYGTQFKIENGKMYLREVIEPEKLEERRAEINLPPMEEYLKMLEKMYKMPVVRP